MEDKIMSEALAATRQLIAFDPGELKTSQDGLKDWFEQKVLLCQEEITDLEQNIEIAIKSKWKVSSLRSMLSKSQKRFNFYAKAKAAVEAGYLLVPNFPIRVFGIRTERLRPPEDLGTSRYGSSFPQRSEGPHLGEAEYKDPIPMRDFSHTETRKDSQGKDYEVEIYANIDFDEVQFPVTTAKPLILQKTSEAMVLKIFDEIGLVGNPRQDPIVVGKIKFKHGYSQKELTFFIAWWMRIEDL